MFQTEKEFKSAVSSLRKALREHYGKNIPSHTQSLELLATVLGATSYAQLRTRWTDAATPTSTLNADPTPASSAPVTDNPDERLRNDKGQFDLVDKGAEGTVLSGRDFQEMNGTVEDIFYCVASADTGYRQDGGQLVPEYDGGTDVNWDGQETRVDANGDTLWELTDSCEAVPSSTLILVPEDFSPEADPGEDGKWPWRVRENLLDAYLDYAKRHGLVNKLIAGQTEFWDLEDDTLEQVADALGFGLHYGEVERLIERLKEI